MSRQVGARKQRYPPEMLAHAAEMVRTEALSLNKAAKKFGIPKTTLQNTVHGKYRGHKVGTKTVLSQTEEGRIVGWAVHMARIGYGRTRQELLTTVKRIIEEDGRPNPFQDNKPGRAWLQGFLKRNPSLSLRTTIQLGKERAIISPDKICNWFKTFKTYIEEEVGDKDLLQDPTRIYNADETGVSLCMKGNQVIGIKGAPVVYHFGNSDKTQLTVMAACSAAAHFIPPMIVFPGQRFSYNPLEGFDEAVLGRSENGWMDSILFCNWLENVFVPAINSRNVKKPVLLLIDGHSTHVTMEASNICLTNGIELYCLLEHASHVLQPLDLRLFSALKKNWRQAVRDWQMDHVGEYVTKATFSQVFKTAWYKSTTVDAAVKGFKEAGLFPLDERVVAESIKIDPSKVFASCTVPSTATVSTELPAPTATSTVSCTVQSAPTPSTSTEMEITPPAGKDQEDQQLPMEPTHQRDVLTTIPLNVNAPSSPFSKHLKIPSPKVTKPKPQRVAVPKAITGLAYRRLMEEKRKKKEEEERAKEHRKEERIQKRIQKEEKES